MGPNMIQTGYDQRLFGKDGQETINRLQSGLLLADLGFFIIHFFHGFHPVVGRYCHLLPLRIFKGTQRNNKTRLLTLKYCLFFFCLDLEHRLPRL